MAGMKRKRKVVRPVQVPEVKAPVVEVKIAEEVKPKPEPPVVKEPEPTTSGSYPFIEVCKFTSVDGREVRKMEVCKGNVRGSDSLVKTSSRFYDEAGSIVASSEALAVLQKITPETIRRGELEKKRRL